MSEIKSIFKSVKDGFNSKKSMEISYRRQQLNQLYDLLNDNQPLLIEALMKDLRKPSFETVMAEIDYVRNEVLGMLFNLDKYTSPQHVGKSLPAIGDEAFVQSEPYGVVLILGTWNYPIQVPLSPLAGAIAAGNAAIIKPSEIAANTAICLQNLFEEYMDQVRITRPI